MEEPFSAIRVLAHVDARNLTHRKRNISEVWKKEDPETPSVVKLFFHHSSDAKPTKRVNTGEVTFPYTDELTTKDPLPSAGFTLVHTALPGLPFTREAREVNTRNFNHWPIYGRPNAANGNVVLDTAIGEGAVARSAQFRTRNSNINPSQG